MKLDRREHILFGLVLAVLLVSIFTSGIITGSFVDKDEQRGDAAVEEKQTVSEPEERNSEPLMQEEAAPETEQQAQDFGAMTAIPGIKYQENANATSTSGGAVWTNGADTYDMNWATHGDCSGAATRTCDLHVNYSKPEGIILDVIWQTEFGNGGMPATQNISLYSTTCINRNPIELWVESINQTGSNYYTKWWCRSSGGSWTSLNSNWGMTSDYMDVYEEAVFWSVSTNVTSCMNLTANNTVYSLTSDLSGVQSGKTYCVNINHADNITLDCKGKKIDSDDLSGHDYGILINNSRNIYLKNCFISDYYKSGVYVENTYKANITNSTIFSINNASEPGCGRALVFDRGSNNSFVGSSNISNNRYGVYIWQYGGGQIEFYNITVANNAQTGVTHEGGYTYGSLSKSKIYDNAGSNGNLYIYSAVGLQITDSVLYGGKYAVKIESSANDNHFTNDTVYNSTDYDVYIDSSSGTFFNNLTLNSTRVSLEHGTGNVRLKSATAPSGGDPSGNYSIGKYVNLTATKWVYLNVSYETTDLGAVNESTLKLFKNTSGSWTSSLGTTTNGANTAANYVYANITSFSSIFAPMGEVGTELAGCTELSNNNSVYTLTAGIGTTKTGSDKCIIIDGKSNITLDCNGYKISGNDTAGCNYGIYVTNSKDITIKDCFTQHYYGAGIYVANSNNTLIYNTTAYSNYNVTLSTGRGMQLYPGANYTNITGSNISSNYWGLVLEASGSQNSTFYNNVIHDNANHGIIALGGYNLYNTFIKNNVYNNLISQIELDGEDYAYFENNTIYGSSIGALSLSGSDNCTFKNNVIPIASYAISLYNSLGNEFTNITVNKTSFNFTYDYNITIYPASAPAGGGLAGYSNIGKYISITNNSADSWIFINITYSNSDIGYLNESSLRIFKNSSGNWSQELNASGALVSGVNTAGNYVYANISNFGSVFAPMGTNVGTEVSSCTDLSSGNTVYVLTKDITGNDTDGRCIDISADDVTLDCQGYSITGSDPKIGTTGVYAEDVTNVTLLNCDISEYDIGIEISDVNQSIFTNNSLSGNNDSDVKLSDSDDNQNNFTNLDTKNALVSFDYEGDISINSSNAPPLAEPPNYDSIGEYIELHNDSADAWIFINMSYTDSDVLSVKESDVRIWKHVSGVWSQNLNATGALVSGINTISNYVYANISSFGSIFGPMGQPNSFGITVNSPTAAAYIGNSSNKMWFNITTGSAAKNCTFNIDGTGDVLMQNSSTTKWFNQSYFTTTGNHNVTFKCYDTSDESASPVTVYFAIDWTEPIINLTSPANGATVTSDDVTIRATVNEAASTCKVETDGDDNTTMTNSSGDWHTTVTLANGMHNATVYCADVAVNWNKSNSVVFNVSFTEGGNGGGGGGGGGTGGTTGDTGIFPFTNIPVGVYRDVNSSNNVIDIIIISLKVNSSITGQIAVKQLTGIPIGVSEPLDEAYRYFQFTSTNIPYSQIIDGSIYFRISKAWITSNNIDTDSVVMHRYSNGWQALSTEFTGSDATYYYFKAKSTMFSYFVITGKAAAVTPQPVKNETPVIIPTPTAICGDGICDIVETSFSCASDCPGPTEEQKETGVGLLAIAGISAFAIIIAGAVVFFVFIRPRLAGAAAEEMPMSTEVEILPEKEHMLEAYIRTSISGGHSQQDIVNALEKAGWTNEQIETAFELAMVPPQKEEALIEYVQNEFTKGYREEQINQKLIGVGWSAKEARHAIKMAQKQFSKA